MKRKNEKGGDEERHIHKHAEKEKQRDTEKNEIDSEIE